MRNPAQNNRGTTLVELVVCMALLGVFSVAVVALMQPCSKAFLEIQQLLRAQNVADSVIERLRGEVLQATGSLRITNGDAVGGEGAIFALTQPSEVQGSALEFGLESGYLELIDAGSIAPTELTAAETLLDPVAKTRKSIHAVPGYLHLRYYKPDTEEASRITGYVGCTYPPLHRAADDGNRAIAYNYTEAFPQNSYMGMTVALQFTVRGHTETRVPYQTGQATASRVNSVAVLVTVMDAANQVVCTQKSILALPQQPVLVQKGP